MQLTNPQFLVIMIVASMATVAITKEAKLRGATSGQSATAAMHAGVAALSET
jgi:hypothetical protein